MISILGPKKPSDHNHRVSFKIKFWTSTFLYCAYLSSPMQNFVKICDLNFQNCSNFFISNHNLSLVSMWNQSYTRVTLTFFYQHRVRRILHFRICNSVEQTEFLQYQSHCPQNCRCSYRPIITGQIQVTIECKKKKY